MTKELRLRKFSGATFKDVLLPPLGKNLASSRYSGEISLATRFSTNIPLRQPLVSANMIDVTESKMAISCALTGGLGIYHRFCQPDRQAKGVRDTKRAHNFIIKNPYCIRPTTLVGEARNIMQTRGVDGLLVSDDENRLVGILTKVDIRWEDDGLAVEHRMTRRPYIAQENHIKSPSDAIRLFKEHKIKKLPIVGKNRVIKGLVTAKDVERLQHYPMANLDKNGNLIVGATIGAIGDYLERAQELKKVNVDVLVMDVTSAHSASVEKAIKALRRTIGNYELIVGNAGSSEQANFLIEQGVQGIKIGIGPGGPCTTRLSTGIGVSQLFAVLETFWNLVFKYNYKPENIPPLCADGNIRTGGDINYALLAGASSVMIGTLFAGTEETPGQTYEKEDGLYKRYVGMASIEAAIARATATGIEDPVMEALKKAPEGISREVKIKGSVENVIYNLLGGVKSGISHRGVLSLAEFKMQNPLDVETGFQLLHTAAQRESFER